LGLEIWNLKSLGMIVAWKAIGPRKGLSFEYSKFRHFDTPLERNLCAFVGGLRVGKTTGHAECHFLRSIDETNRYALN